MSQFELRLAWLGLTLGNRMKNIFLNRYAGAWLALFSFAAFIAAQTPESSTFPNIAIENFGKMDERYYRGAQPLPSDFQSLKDLGIKTVIDLRNDPTDYEKPAVEALGMKYVNIPMSGWKYPKDSDVEQFLKLMDDAETGTVFVHCKAGRHRTGVVGAVYRFQHDGWNYDQAYDEMKKFRYRSWPVHYNMKGYVRDYFKKMETTKLNAAAAVLQIGTTNGN